MKLKIVRHPAHRKLGPYRISMKPRLPWYQRYPKRLRLLKLLLGPFWGVGALLALVYTLVFVGLGWLWWHTGRWGSLYLKHGPKASEYRGTWTAEGCWLPGEMWLDHYIGFWSWGEIVR